MPGTLKFGAERRWLPSKVDERRWPLYGTVVFITALPPKPMKPIEFLFLPTPLVDGQDSAAFDGCMHLAGDIH